MTNRTPAFRSQVLHRIITASFTTTLVRLLMGFTLTGCVTVQPQLEWGPKYVTPGVKLTLEELSRTTKSGKQVVEYKLVASGFPQDKTYTLWLKNLGRQPETFPGTGFRVDTSGSLLLEQSGKAVKFSRLHLSDFAKGEPLEVMLTSDDQRVRGYARVILHPIEAKDGRCRLSVELGSRRGDLFLIGAEGFEPSEEVRTVSRYDGDVVEDKLTASPGGKFGVVVVPPLKVKRAGTASFTAISKTCEVTVSYEWGPPALKTQ